MKNTKILELYSKEMFKFDTKTLTFTEEQMALIDEFENDVIQYFNNIFTVEDYIENEKVIKKIRALVNGVKSELDKSRLSEKKELTTSIDRLAQEIKHLFDTTKPSIERLQILESQMIEKFIAETNDAIDEYIVENIENWDQLSKLNKVNQDTFEGLNISAQIIEQKIPKQAYNKISDNDLIKLINSELDQMEQDLTFLEELNPKKYLQWYLESFDMDTVVLKNRLHREKLEKEAAEKLAKENPVIEETLPEIAVTKKPVVKKQTTVILQIKSEDLDKALKVLKDAQITVLTK